MVLEIKTIKCLITFIVSIFTINAFADSTSNRFEGPLSAKVSGFELYIQYKGEKAYLKYSQSNKGFTIPISLPFPCHFSSNEKGDPITVEWNNNIKVLLIENSEPDLNNADWCKTELQGLVIHNENIYLSDTIIKVSFCPPNRHDNKIYYYYAEEFYKNIKKNRLITK